MIFQLNVASAIPTSDKAFTVKLMSSPSVGLAIRSFVGRFCVPMKLTAFWKATQLGKFPLLLTYSASITGSVSPLIVGMVYGVNS